MIKVPGDVESYRILNKTLISYANVFFEIDKYIIYITLYMDYKLNSEHARFLIYVDWCKMT